MLRRTLAGGQGLALLSPDNTWCAQLAHHIRENGSLRTRPPSRRHVLWRTHFEVAFPAVWGYSRGSSALGFGSAPARTVPRFAILRSHLIHPPNSHNFARLLHGVCNWQGSGKMGPYMWCFPLDVAPVHRYSQSQFVPTSRADRCAGSRRAHPRAAAQAPTLSLFESVSKSATSHRDHKKRRIVALNRGITRSPSCSN